jgi:hypothetical protein
MTEYQEFKELPDLVTPRNLLTVIESFSVTARSLQATIGVSEIGMSCQRCIIRKLAMLPKTLEVGSWRAQLGTYVHGGLAEDFESRYGESGKVIIEQSLTVHTYKDFVLRGSCDAFFPNDGKGLVVDWKIVGDDTLDSVRNGKVKEQYIVQGNLYALGWELLGYPIEKVAIMFMPANKGNLQRDAVPVEFPYDRLLAANALAKIETYIDLAEKIGWENLLKQHSPQSGCFSCGQYTAVDNPVSDLLLR